MIKTFLFWLKKNYNKMVEQAVMVGAVSKISAFQPQGPQFDPGSAEI